MTINRPDRNKSIESRFERLRCEVVRFLVDRAKRFPELETTIDSVKSEIENAQLPSKLPEPLRLPGCKHLDAALDMAKNGPMAELAEAFANLEPSLRWIRTEHYREQLGNDYMDNYGYTNILGYDALVPHNRVIVAFFVIGPGRHYPRHHHEAEEVYFPFGGDTLWGQNDGSPIRRAPGEPIHNTPWLPHEMITQNTPLFTFCFWVSPGPIQLAQLAN